jgi:hypothetical protein
MLVLLFATPTQSITYSHRFTPSLTPQNVSPSITLGCIAPNPDIAGLGVRLSVYIQSFISLALAILFAKDAFVDSREEKMLRRVTFNLFLTACALLLSAFIQAATVQLSLHHALIILNLSWMVITSALVVIIFSTIHRFQHLRGWTKKLWPSRTSQLPIILLVTTYFCAMASFGIWVWTKSAVFGITPECTPETFTTIFTYDISTTNTSFRIFSLVIYAVAAIPGVNIVLFASMIGACGVGTVVIVASIMRTPFTYRPLYLVALAVQCLINTLLVVDTELMIYRSRDLIAEGESVWTFSQTLALFLVIRPLLDSAHAIIWKAQRTPLGKRVVNYMEWWFQGQLRNSGESWEEFYERTSDEIHQVLEFVKTERSAPEMDRPTVHAFAAAESALTAADAALTAADAIFRPDAPAAASSSYVCPVANITRASETVARAHEDVVAVQMLWFPGVYKNRLWFSAVKGSLGSAKAALDSAERALQTVDR